MDGNCQDTRGAPYSSVVDSLMPPCILPLMLLPEMMYFIRNS